MKDDVRYVTITCEGEPTYGAGSASCEVFFADFERVTVTCGDVVYDGPVNDAPEWVRALVEWYRGGAQGDFVWNPRGPDGEAT